MSMQKKLLIVANSARELEVFKGDFISETIAAGYRVSVICRGDNFYITALEKRGAQVILANALKNSLSVLADLKYSWQLARIIKTIKPDVVFNYTIKPVIYSSIVARFCGIKSIVSMLPGLGYLFSNHSLKNQVSQFLCICLYRLAIRCNQYLIFLNHDDQSFFLQRKIMPAEKSKLVDGEGVNLQHYADLSYPDFDKIVFLFVARMMREKGIFEFIKAAEQVLASHANVEFRIAGDFDEKSEVVLKNLMQTFDNHTAIKYLGYVKDIRVEISKSHVFVLPSYYREGLPRSSMECMAMGRPIITSDWVGCKETVIAGKNGYLVPIKDADALASAMIRFVQQPDIIPQMGKVSREIAEQRFDMKIINAKLLALIGQV